MCFVNNRKKNEEHLTRTIKPSRITNILPCVALSDNDHDGDDDNGGDDGDNDGDIGKNI
jgi:hypothetical protein